MILAFFGGLRHFEIMELQLEKFRVTADGVIVTHQRAKQRSDKRESNFLIPRSSTGTNYASIIEEYLQIIKTAWKVHRAGSLDGQTFFLCYHTSWQEYGCNCPERNGQVAPEGEHERVHFPLLPSDVSNACCR